MKLLFITGRDHHSCGQRQAHTWSEEGMWAHPVTSACLPPDPRPLAPAVTQEAAPPIQLLPGPAPNRESVPSHRCNLRQPRLPHPRLALLGYMHKCPFLLEPVTSQPYPSPPAHPGSSEATPRGSHTEHSESCEVLPSLDPCRGKEGSNEALIPLLPLPTR